MEEIKHSDYKSNMKATSKEEIESAINLKDFSFGDIHFIHEGKSITTTKIELDTDWYCVGKYYNNGYIFKQKIGLREIIINMRLGNSEPKDISALVLPDEQIKKMFKE